MSSFNILGLAGSFSVPSRTRRLVEESVARAVDRYGGRSNFIDI